MSKTILNKYYYNDSEIFKNVKSKYCTSEFLLRTLA